ncbi:hypothetical protein HRUBRA_01785 [Pseudohaliea rubra DSM 19751]|uniref:Uncharacterized protein n=1 Tax=Pseudohaliea rubra DSM 19751 TaxID=1265313 RepID=A0A095XUN4_9GAMM|nr:hypothetical protein HRUBRA_01785 [Pseudohaliea rubra DSM 19751]
MEGSFLLAAWRWVSCGADIVRAAPRKNKLLPWTLRGPLR